ncbi:MAG: hypothetical protein LUH19_09260 [Lachnospiraceae bacterium]|nr:hypothetical protein [Lachnospiraceae bacterium]
MNFLDNMLIAIACRVNLWVEEFKSDEHGVATFVATIILILIVVLLAVLFWSYIKEWFNSIWERITSGTNSIS